MNKKGLIKRFNNAKIERYDIYENTMDLKKLSNRELPKESEVFKYISFRGGFASINFIKFVADKETILELTASTLRIGEKQFDYLSQAYSAGKIKKSTFFIGSIMQEDGNKYGGKYDYYKRFRRVCEKNQWDCIVINNHSKIILMRTDRNYYVLETSSNLNENPKIEQFGFENNKELYAFYYGVFERLKEGEKNGRTKTTDRISVSKGQKTLNKKRN